MSVARRHIVFATALSVAAAVTGALSGVGSTRAAEPGGTSAGGMGEMPTTRPARSQKAISADMQSTMQQLRAALAGGALTDTAKRTAAAPTVIPLARREMSLMDELAAAPGVAANQRAMVKSSAGQFEAMLYLFGDKDTVARVDAAPADDTKAAGVKLQSQWMAAGSDAAAQQPVADAVEKLDAAHTADQGLTGLTMTFAMSAVAPEVKAKLMDTATGTMKNPLATRYKSMVAQMKAQEKAQAEAQAKQKEMVGKPLTISATTVDGKAFSSDEYKGKVVLVDFWASWCGPCKAELPRVKELYAKYHDKGLEVIGVDNDYTTDAVKTYTAQNNMPWVELYDSAAADQHQWNPTTTGYGIFGIPVMFLIDKKGVLRTVEARSQMETEIPKLLAE